MRLNATTKAKVIGNLVADVFAGREEAIKKGWEALFYFAIQHSMEEADSVYINSIPLHHRKKLVCSTQQFYIDGEAAAEKLMEKHNKLEKKMSDKQKSEALGVDWLVLQTVLKDRKRDNRFAVSCFSGKLDLNHSWRKTLSSRVSVSGKETFCPRSLMCGGTLYLDNAADPVFVKLCELHSTEIQLWEDRHKLLKEMLSLMRSVTTDKQLAEFDEGLMKYLPKPEKVAKPPTITPDRLNNLISCCKTSDPSKKPC